MPDVTVAASPGAGFARADLTTFYRLEELGLVVTGQRLEAKRAVLACRVVDLTSVTRVGLRYRQGCDLR